MTLRGLRVHRGSFWSWLAAVVLAAILEAVLPTMLDATAEARTRNFCAVPPFFGGKAVDCGRHVQPGCDTGSTCDAGFHEVNVPITIDCPVGDDDTVTVSCVQDVPDCSVCGGHQEPPCPDEAAAFCTPGCEPGHVEIASLCFAGCGGSFQPPCPGVGCQDGFNLQVLLCVPCGGADQAECFFGAPCRGGNRPLGPNPDGHRACGACGGAARSLACESGCDPGFYHADPVNHALSGSLTACELNDQQAHFVGQNGLCSPAFPEVFTRSDRAWPPEESTSTQRATAVVLHGRGADCADVSELLDTGTLLRYDVDVYCAEYNQDDGHGRRLVRILPTADDPRDGLPPCFFTGSCEFDSANPVLEVEALTPTVRGIAEALFTAIATIPTEGEIVIIAHSGGGFIARELVHRHYDALRDPPYSKVISRVITLGHPYYGKIMDPRLYAPFYCSEHGDFDCEMSRWLWGWQESIAAPAGGDPIDNTTRPQIHWTAVSGSGTDAQGNVRHPAGESYDDACLAVFGGVNRLDVAGDTNVPIQSPLGRDEFGFFAVSELAFDLRETTPCTHDGGCMLRELLARHPDLLPGLATVLVIDEDSIDNGRELNFFSAVDVNDDIAAVGLRAPLRFFAANVGQTITLLTGQVGDEGWFALKAIPAAWDAAGPVPGDGLRNYVAAGPGLGSPNSVGRREALLGNVPRVTPLRASGLKALVGRKVCGVVHASDVSINYGPLSGSLRGANLGTVAFEVLAVRQRLTGSSSSLPEVDVRILDTATVCQGSLKLFTEAPEPASSSQPFDVVP